MLKHVIIISLCCGFMSAAGAAAPVPDNQRALALSRAACTAREAADLAGAVGAALRTREDIARGGRVLGWRATLDSAGGDRFEIRRVMHAGRLRGLQVEWWRADRPHLAFTADAQCRITAGRRMRFGAGGEMRAIVYLDSRLRDTGRRDPVNPPVPPGGAATPGVNVALVDSGVNYTLPVIHTRLARDETGVILGYDFWDLDRRPFDANPTRSVFFPQRHGTRTASLLLREAPGVNLVPYRYPRPDMSRMTALLRAVARHELRLVGMPLGSPKPEDWQAFAAAARDMSDTLFIVSAGNRGLDIDQYPSYPAALGLSNMVVVTSADGEGYPAPGSNWGRRSVDLLVPAENLTVLDFDGAPRMVSGSSYAVSRVIALLARLLETEPRLSAAELKRRLAARAVNPGYDAFVRIGYLPDPLLMADDVRIASTDVLAPPAEHDAAAHPTLDLSLNVALLNGSGWRETEIPALIAALDAVLAQCQIRVSGTTLYRLQTADRLLDFNAAHGHTIATRGGVPTPAVYLVRDTLRDPAFAGEAFGRANSKRLTWLRDTVWLTAGIRDPAVALAHELFHVITDSGEHVDTPGNLMHRRTTPGGVALSETQCTRARATGLASGLLRSP